MNILIIGANSGLGFEIFKILKKNKRNNFYLISKNINKIKSFKYIKAYKCNLKNISSLKKICNKISKHSENKIDLIICNSAQGTFGRIDEIEFKDYLNDLNVNFFSHLLIIKNFLPGIKLMR